MGFPILEHISLWDIFIMLIGVLNIVIFVFCLKSTNEIHKKTLTSVLNVDDSKNEYKHIYQLPLTEVVDMWKKNTMLYSWFINISSLFPILGIGGTIYSLCNIAANEGDFRSNFFLALTTTFWGLVFSFISKILESFIAPKIELVEVFMNQRLEKIYGDEPCVKIEQEIK